MAFDGPLRPTSDPGVKSTPVLPTPKIIQLQPWHDLLLGLTDTGEIYRLEVFAEGPSGYRIICDAIPLFPGFPRGWPRR